jgi:Tc toxin complex TcA C-terminal TcB-binding domain
MSPDESQIVEIQTQESATGNPLGGVALEVVGLRGRSEVLLARAVTDARGMASLALDPVSSAQQVSIRVVGSDVVARLGRERVDVDETAVLEVPAAKSLESEHAILLADHLVATRRVRVDDVAAELADPPSDSAVRLLPAPVRVLLLRRLEQSERRSQGAGSRMIDPVALRDGRLRLIPLRDLPHGDGQARLDLDPVSKPFVDWDRFGWALPDDQSYRDYLRSVFVLFVHQQKLGFAADPRTFPAVVEKQLRNRFFQDFRTSDRAEVPLTSLLVPIVTAIVTAAKGSGFGFGISPVPAQGTLSDREHLDALLALTGIGVEEFSNRYRLPLTAPDGELSTPVRLNIHTLSRILSDTAQGPVEPPENVIDPQLPGVEGKPILWEEVVGSAPFFLRFDEWLARQQPFFGENLFSLRSQVEGVARGIWLDEARKQFLDYHKGLPPTWSMTRYSGYFGSMDEVHRSADFLLRYGAADAKLKELVEAIDHSQFPKAARLVDEAEQLLSAASFTAHVGEDWTPPTAVGNFSWPLSFPRRRSTRVTSITELTGTEASYVPDGLERFYKLDRPSDLWKDIVQFRGARDEATRLREYQQRFLLPMLRAKVRVGLGDLPGAVDQLGKVTGMHVGIAAVGTPAGMIRDPGSLVANSRLVAGRFRSSDPLGDRPYTARLVYYENRRLDGPFSLTPQNISPGYDLLKPVPPILHPVEERFAQLAQADAMLAWAETLYRTDDPSALERARELYKAVLFVHGEDPGTSAFAPARFVIPSVYGLVENPRRRSQLDRARLALHQLDAGLNFYGYNEEAVPTLRYEALADAAQRWVSGAKSAQSDFLNYLSRVEQSDLDMLLAKAQQRKARATVAIAAEQVEIAKSGVVVAQKMVTDVEKAIAAKQAEIDDANSIFSQFSDYFDGMKSSISSMIDVGKGASEGWTSLSTSGVGDALGLGEAGGGAGAAGGATESVGLGSAMGGLGVVGGFAAFAVLSTTTLQGMADAATKRQGELIALEQEALPAARAAVRVQERHVTIAELQGQIAASELAYATDLVNFENERFLNRDFWDALAGVAGRTLHRYLDLAGQAAWLAERALAYRLGTSLRVIKLGYFDLRMRDLGGADRLALDLAELEAVRLSAARVTVPITRTYSLARDLPLAFGQLKRHGSCSFALSDDDLVAAYPGTFAHRIRAVDVFVDTPGTVAAPSGILSNGGFSMLRRDPDGPRVPLLRFADAYPISEFRIRKDLELHGMPGEQLLPFEGTAFTTTWTLQVPKAANPSGLARITDIRITFDLQAAYDPRSAGLPVAPAVVSRSLFVSALATDAKGLATLSKKSTPARLTFDLAALAVPSGSVVTNLAVVIPGVNGGSYDATLRIGRGAPTTFVIKDGLASSNLGVLSDGDPGNAQPLNAAAGGSPTRPMTLEIIKGPDRGRLKKARDVLLWVEYEVA